MRRPATNRWLPSLAGRFGRCVGVAVLLSRVADWTGCVAVNIGREKTFLHEFANVETDAEPRRTTLERARVDLRQRGMVAVVSLDADVLEEYAQRRHVKQVTVRRQKRLAVGLFPGAAELVWMPKGALASAMTVARSAYDSSPRYCGYYADRNPGLKELALVEFFMVFTTIGPFLYTADSLFCAPFEPWHCDSHDFIDMEYWQRGVEHGGKRVADASSSPRLRALAELPEDLRREIGVQTCFDVRSTGTGNGEHLGVAGFHKYLAIFVEISEPEEILGTELRRKKTAVTGPFEVELSIPGLGHSERRLVPAGETSATFELPGAPHDTSIEARVHVREVRNPGDADTPALTTAAIRDLAGQGNRFDVNLRARGGGAGVKRAGYEVVEIRAVGNGRYAIRVRIAEPGERDAVAEAVAMEVRRRIREDFAIRHPSVRVDEVRDCVQGEAESEDPSVLAFEGWAFAARPLSEGWRYDAETGRGEVRVWVSEGIPEDRAVQWARKNIAAIVGDKASALSAGGAPETGARFRCLGGRFENGILAIGFEKEE